MSNQKKPKGINITLKSENDISTHYPNLATAQRFDNQSGKFVKMEKDTDELEEGYKYGTTILIEKDSQVAKDLIKTVNAIWKEYDLDKNRKANYPISDGNKKADELEKQDKNGDVFKNKLIVKTGTKKKPKVFTTKGAWKGSTKQSDEAINGWFCNVMLHVKYYKAGTNCGVTCYLNGLQLISENPDMQFSANPENEFDFEESNESSSNDGFYMYNGSTIQVNDNDKKDDGSDMNIDNDSLPF